MHENALEKQTSRRDCFARTFRTGLNLLGYVTCGSPCERTGKDIRVCTLVKRGTAFIDHALDISEESDIDHTLIDVVPGSGTRKTGLFVLNVYSTPSKRGLTHNFSALFREAMAKAASSHLLICGDFNAPHTQWGYGTDSPKGKRLAGLMDELGLVVLNEPESHTRIGQGACRDTSPDLSIWSDAGVIAWSNSFEDLGSDHRILCVTGGRIRKRGRWLPKGQNRGLGQVPREQRTRQAGGPYRGYRRMVQGTTRGRRESYQGN
ncbi:hypothetical protein MTO96_051488 [Rhipicephalus appendiculatus]